MFYKTSQLLLVIFVVGCSANQDSDIDFNNGGTEFRQRRPWNIFSDKNRPNRPETSFNSKNTPTGSSFDERPPGSRPSGSFVESQNVGSFNGRPSGSRPSGSFVESQNAGSFNGRPSGSRGQAQSFGGTQNGVSFNDRPSRLPSSGSLLENLQVPQQDTQQAFFSSVTPQKQLKEVPRVEQDVITLVPCSCPHSTQYSPVCSTSSQTYHNRAIMDCYRTCGYNVQFARNGPCNQVAGRGVLF